MFNGHKVGALLLMGGRGERFCSQVPKQFALLGGKPLYRYALHTFLQTGFFDQIVLVCHPDWMEMARGEEGVCVVEGGATRQKSSFLGVAAFSPMPDFVLIHDAVRPFVTKEIVERNLHAVIAGGAVDTCIPSADTLVFAPGKEKVQSIPNREDFLRGQTPQTFRLSWLLEAQNKAEQEGICNASDDCHLLLNAGFPVSVVRGSEENIKVTVDFDLVIAEALMQNRQISC